MPSVDELLEKAELNLKDLEDKTVIEDSNKYLEIDPINRKVIIPNDEIIFGVTRDLNCERKYFKVARYVGNNLDMSNAHIYVNYQNANGDLYSYVVDDIKLEENTVTFSWVLSDKVVEYKGDVLFSVCAFWSNNDGIEINRWNTTFAKGTSLEGLQLGDIPSTGGVDQTQANATEDNVESGKTFFSGDSTDIRTGNLINRGRVVSQITKKEDSIIIEKGIHNGNGYVKISDTEKTKLIEQNIRKGVTILGVVGEYEGTGATGETNVAQGTITGAGAEAVMIDTGLTSVSKIIIFRGGTSSESGILTLIYIDGGVKSVGVSYGQYLSTISYSVGELTVNGGNVTYTPKSETATTNLMQNKEYTWIAIE